MNWWERWPGRLSIELARLRELGFKTEFSENAALRAPIIVRGTYPLGGVEYKLEIHFPDLYPYFRAEVLAPELDLLHHQNPLGKNVCLLGRNTDNWDTNDLIGDVIASQLPDVLKSEGVAAEGGTPNEEMEAEPWTEYLNPRLDFRILWNADISVPSGLPGKLELSYRPRQDVFTAFVSRVRRGNDDLFIETTPPFAGATVQEWIHFVSLDRQPPSNGGAILQAYPEFHPEKHLRKFGSTHGCLLGLFYPEEIGHRHTGTGLTFVLFGKPSKQGQMLTQYIKAYRTGVNYVQSRLGPYGSIAGRKVLLVGYGNLGSAVAADLCKLGVQELTLVDHDVFEPGNLSRHWLGMQHFGTLKAEAGAVALGATYPYTTVKALAYRLGESGRADKTAEFMRRFVSSDLIFDCSGERAVQHFLSNEAWDQGKDFAFVEGYPGMLGGFAGLVRPGVGPCFLCFLAGGEDNSVPLPPLLPDGRIQPPGCAEPTFVGASFDGETLAAAAMRTLFSYLTGPSRYPADPGPYCRIALANEDCTKSIVRIDPIRIEKRASCALCGNR